MAGVVGWYCVNFQCRGVLWIKVGQGPVALAVGAGRGCLDIFLSSIFSLFFLPLWETARHTVIPSQKAVKPKTINQPIFRGHYLNAETVLISGGAG